MSPYQPTRISNHPLLTVRQAAEFLGVSEKTVRRAIAAGGLTASRVGRQWRISHESLFAFFSGRSNARSTPVR
jgi:DNA binding domain, excisionase family